MQSWVSQSVVRSVSDEPESMQQAAENRRRIMGSSLFGGDEPPPQQRRYDPPPQRISQPAQDPPPSQTYQSQSLPRTQYNADYSPSSTFNYSPATQMASTTINFPDIQFDAPPPVESFSMSLRPRMQQRSTNVHRLDVPPNTQMRQLRDELNRDTERFNQKLRQIGQI